MHPSLIIRILTVLYLFFFFWLLIADTACTPKSALPFLPEDSSARQTAIKKIHFDLSEIDGNGMIGPLDGKRSVAYKFSIPREKKKRKEVAAIDSSVKFFADGDDLYFCIGEGGTREILIELAGLNYIKSINPFYGE